MKKKMACPIVTTKSRTLQAHTLLPLAHCYWVFEGHPNTPGLLDALFLFFSLDSTLLFMTRVMVVCSINDIDTGPHGHRTELKEGHSQVEKEHKKQEWEPPELHRPGEPRWKPLLGSHGKEGHLSAGVILSQKAMI